MKLSKRKKENGRSLVLQDFPTLSTLIYLHFSSLLFFPMKIIFYFDAILKPGKGDGGLERAFSLLSLSLAKGEEVFDEYGWCRVPGLRKKTKN